MITMNKKAHTLWYRVTGRKKIQELTSQFREKLGIPKSGFQDSDKADFFLKKVSNNNSKMGLIADYLKGCKEDIDIPHQLTRTMMVHLVNDWVYLKDIDINECELDLSEYFKNGKIKIQFGVFTPLKDIERFINKKGWEIRFFQSYYLKKHGLKKPGRIRSSKAENLDRDSHIYYLGTTYSKNELYQQLKSLDPKSPDKLYKEQIISRLMERIFKNKISSDTVKMIISRQKKLREGPAR